MRSLVAGVAALLLGAAAVCSSVVLRFPVHVPEM